MVRYRVFSVYIVANRPFGVIYTGLTSEIVQRIGQHREGAIPGFTAKYNCKRLVWYEHRPNADAAILREKRIKRWVRDWRLALIDGMNPTWRDLWPDLLREEGYSADGDPVWKP
jgi:putative endonuclease